MRDPAQDGGNATGKDTSGPANERGRRSGSEAEADGPRRTFFSRQSVTLEQLRSFRRLFQRLEGHSKVDERTFIALVTQVLGSAFSRATMQQLFMKIDANSDGDLTWDEFVDFLFFSQQDTRFGGEGSGETLYTLSPSESMEEGAAQSERLLRAETQVGMDFFPSLSAFVSWSREGAVRLWNPTTLELQCTLRTTTDGSEDWVTAVAHMSQSGKLAIASLKSCITLVDMGSEYKKVFGRIHQREFRHASPLCLEYCYLSKPAPGALAGGGARDGREVLFVGDDAGVVTICEFPARTWSVGNFFSLHGVKGNRIRRFRKHRDHITKIAYIEELELLLTASLDSDMYALDVEKNTVRTSFTRHTKAIYDFQWISSAKVVASCGLQADIYLWSPYSAAAFQRLTGHTSYISRLLLMDEKLVSIAAQKEVKLWDVRNQRCILTLDAEVLLGGAKVTAAALEAKSMSVIFAGRRLFPFQLVQPVLLSVSGRTHDRPVVQALYNWQFHQFLTVDTQEVKLWDAATGRQLVAFSVVRDDKGGNEVTTATFDTSMRRLITGDHEGKELRVWNFNSGALLGRMVKTTPAPPPEKPIDTPLSSQTARRAAAAAARARRAKPSGGPQPRGRKESSAGSLPGDSAAVAAAGSGTHQGRAGGDGFQAKHPAMLRLQSGNLGSPGTQGSGQRGTRRMSMRSQLSDLTKVAASSPPPRQAASAEDGAEDSDSHSTATEEVLETAVGAEAADQLLAPVKVEKRVRKREVTSIAHSLHRAPAAPGERAELTQFVLCSGWDRNIHVWLDEAMGEGQQQVPTRGNDLSFPADPSQGHMRDVTAMCTFLPNGLATGDRAGSVRLWNASSGDPMAAVQCGAEVEALAYIAQASTLVAGLSDGSLSFIDVMDGTEFGVLRCAHAESSTAIMRVTADPSGDYLVTADNKGGIKVWTMDVKGMDAARTGGGGPDAGPDAGQTGDVAALERLAAKVKTQARTLGVRSGSQRGWSEVEAEESLKLIDLGGPPPVGTFVEAFSFWMAHDDSVTAATWVENGRMVDVHLLTSALDGFVKLWTLNGGLVGVLGNNDTWNLNDRMTFRSPSPEMHVVRRRHRVWSLAQGLVSPRASRRPSRSFSRHPTLSRSVALERTLAAQSRPTYVATRQRPLHRGRYGTMPLLGAAAAILTGPGPAASRQRPAPGEVWVRYDEDTADMIGLITVTRVDERQNLVAGWDGLAWSRESKPDTELFLGDFTRDRPLHPWRLCPELTSRVGCIVSDADSPVLYKVVFAAKQGARIAEPKAEATPARKGRGLRLLQRRGSLAAGGTESTGGLLRRRSDRSPSPRARSGSTDSPRSAGRGSVGSPSGGAEPGSPSPLDTEDNGEQNIPEPKPVHEECVVVDLTFKEHKLQQMAPGERYPRSMAPLRKAAARILAAHRAKLLRSLALEERRALEAERRKEAGGGGDGEGDAPTSRSSRAPLHRGESFDIGVEQAAARSLEAMSRGGSRRAGSRSQHRREEEDVEEVEERPETPFDASQAPSKTPKIPPIPLLSQHTTIPRWGKVHAGSVSARLPNEPERRPPARSGKNKSLVTEALITHRYEEQSRRRSDGVAPADGGEEPGSRTPSITAQYVMLQMASRAAQARARGPTSHTGPMNGLTLHGIEDLPRSVKDVRAQLTARSAEQAGRAGAGGSAPTPRPPPNAKLGSRPQQRGRLVSGGQSS